jgi:hypothetical protein
MKMHSKIEIDFYEGALGPTVRFYIQTEDQLRELISIFSRLSEGKVTEYRLGKSDLFTIITWILHANGV